MLNSLLPNTATFAVQYSRGCPCWRQGAGGAAVENVEERRSPDVPLSALEWTVRACGRPEFSFSIFLACDASRQASARWQERVSAFLAASFRSSKLPKISLRGRVRKRNLVTSCLHAWKICSPSRRPHRLLPFGFLFLTLYSDR